MTVNGPWTDISKRERTLPQKKHKFQKIGANRSRNDFFTKFFTLAKDLKPINVYAASSFRKATNLEGLTIWVVEKVMLQSQQDGTIPEKQRVSLSK